MIWVYRVLFLPIFIIMLPYFLKRMFSRGGYGKGFSHRFGLIPRLSKLNGTQKRVWIQAVSIGEMKAIEPLIKKLNARGGLEIILTTTTSTAYAIAQTMYADKVRQIGFFPLDFWPFSYLAWKRIQPDLAILMEGELWPEHIYRANKQNVPIILINARLSDRSYKRFKLVSFITKRLFNRLNLILASNEQDEERILSFGVSEERVVHTGNLKFDVQVPSLKTGAEINLLKAEFGFFHKDDDALPIILMGSSTWPGEEAVLLNIFANLIKQGIHARLLLVPRHAERRAEVRELLEKQSLSYHFRSEGERASNECFIYVGDTSGELPYLTQVADIVFVGKSLPPHMGGQTPVECAALKKCMVHGPDMSNFRLFTQELYAHNAAISIKTVEELEAVIVRLCKDTYTRETIASNAKACLSRNIGATDRTMAYLEPYFSSK